MSESGKPRINADLTGRVAIVTGSARGIGLSIAEALAAAGAKVALVDVMEDALTEAVAALEALGTEARGYKCDVTDSEAVKATAKQITKDFGQLDILVNNAGITRDGLMLRMSDEQWESVLDINLKGSFFFLRATARAISKSPVGRIINIASISGMIGNPGQANYSASKAGLISLTRTAAKEFASRGMTVNAVAPGFILTEMTKKLGDEMLENIQKNVPLARLGIPADISDAVLFLASDAAAYITGQTLVVDGGLTV